MAHVSEDRAGNTLYMCVPKIGAAKTPNTKPPHTELLEVPTLDFPPTKDESFSLDLCR